MTVASLIAQGCFAEAADQLRELLAARPHSIPLLLQLSHACALSGARHEAMLALQKVLALQPNHLAALANLAVLHAQIGELTAATKYSQLAVRQDPRNPERHHQLAMIWADRYRYDYASDAMAEALRLAPNRHGWRADLIDYLRKASRNDLIPRHISLLRAMPGDPDELEALLTLLHHAAAYSDWETMAPYEEQLPHALERFLTRRPAANPVGSTRLMFHVDDPAAIFRATVTPPSSRLLPGPLPAPQADGRRVLCYLSADIRNHPVAQMLLPVLRAHDRTRLRVILGALAPRDDSTIAESLYDLFDEVVPLYDRSDREAAEMLRERGVQTLVDLGGTTLGARTNILSYRPAPRQLLWLGCPITTGQHHYDGWVVDNVVATTGYEASCSEPLVRLPVCYHPISLGESSGPSDKQRADFLWPQDGIMVGLLMQPSRISVAFLRQVVAVVAAQPSAVLVLRVVKEQRSKALATLVAWGLPEERIRFIQHIAERADYLALIRHLDVFVDSVPYGGHSTVGEALSMGVPVVASWGATVHARVGGSMMIAMGLGDLVAPDLGSQLRHLQQLLDDSDLRNHWRQRFANAARMQETARNQDLVHHLENVFFPD